MSRLGKAKREREEACYICGHYHDVSFRIEFLLHLASDC